LDPSSIASGRAFWWRHDPPQAPQRPHLAGGAERPNPWSPHAEDYQHTWKLSLDNIEAGWQEKTDIPFLSNHMSYVSILDAMGQQHHFFVGGQVGQNEKSGNIDDIWEYIVATDDWVKHANLPFTRGHASSSTRPLGCGFFQIAGSTNGYYDLDEWGSNGPGKTSDISFSDFILDRWTKIGDMTNPIKHPHVRRQSQPRFAGPSVAVL